MEISNILNKSSPTVVFDINLGFIRISITNTIIMMWIICLVIILLGFLFSRKLKIIPNKKQSLVESIIDLIKGICIDSIGDEGIKYVPFIGTMLIFLVIANVVDILNVFIFNVDIIPPTKDLSIVISLALISIFAVIISSIKYKKITGFFKSFFEPIFIMFPFKIIDYLLKPISLTLRLFGNISVGFMIMAIITSLVPIIIPSFLSLYFDLFDGLLQAYIFVFLTALYIGEVVEE